MTDETWLREGLAEAVPAPPSTPDRAAAAVDRARRTRRRTTAGVAGAAATVLAVALLGSTLGGGFDEPGPAGRGSDDAAAAPFDVAACPPAPGEGEQDPLDVPAPSAPVAVPADAVSVRLCQGAGTAIDAPDDALVVDVDVLVELVNGLEQTGPPEICQMDLGPGYRLVFGYDDGSTFVASGRLYGCHELVVGSGYRADARAAWDRFVALLQDQRADLDPPTPPAASTLACDWDAAYSPLARPQEIAAGVVCLFGDDGTARRAEISPDELDLLLTDMKARTREGAGFIDCAEPPPHPTIGGVTAWGDRIAVRSDCGTTWFAIDDETNAVWQPGEEARAVLDRLVAEAR